jgi:hypothetical protein
MHGHGLAISTLLTRKSKSQLQVLIKSDSSSPHLATTIHDHAYTTITSSSRTTYTSSSSIGHLYTHVGYPLYCRVAPLASSFRLKNGIGRGSQNKHGCSILGHPSVAQHVSVIIIISFLFSSPRCFLTFIIAFAVVTQGSRLVSYIQLIKKIAP